MVYDNVSARQLERMGGAQAQERTMPVAFARIEIPLHDLKHLRVVADRLRQLAHELDLLSRSENRMAHHIAASAWWVCKMAANDCRIPGEHMRKAKDRSPSPLGNGRIEIALDDPIWLRTVADVLRSCAMELDLCSRDADRPLEHVAASAKWAIKAASQKCRRTTISGR